MILRRASFLGLDKFRRLFRIGVAMIRIDGKPLREDEWKFLCLCWQTSAHSSYDIGQRAQYVAREFGKRYPEFATPRAQKRVYDFVLHEFGPWAHTR